MTKKIINCKNIVFLIILFVLTLLPSSQVYADVTLPAYYWDYEERELTSKYLTPDFIIEFVILIIVAFLLTMLFELPILYLFLRKILTFSYLFSIFSVINIITTSLLWIFIYLASDSGYGKNSISEPLRFLTIEALGEFLVFIIEAILIFVLLKILFRYKKTSVTITFTKAALISFCANIVSAVIGTMAIISIMNFIY